jgi:K+-sensing histidine kinase KdpD
VRLFHEAREEIARRKRAEEARRRARDELERRVQVRIFEPFFTTKPPGIGTALGLPLCRGIIEGHGGTMRVQSQPGHGTVFRMGLPAYPWFLRRPQLLTRV